jgi:hypothetical protein
MFCPAFTETYGNFCLVARALNLNDNTFAKDCVFNIIANFEINKVICLARL